MVNNNVWIPVPKSDVPQQAKVLTSTWAMKKKANGTFRARLNCRGFEQVPGIHYDPKSIAAPVVTLMTIRIVFVIMIMPGWTGHVLDVRGAFLKGDFADGEFVFEGSTGYGTTLWQQRLPPSVQNTIWSEAISIPILDVFTGNRRTFRMCKIQGGSVYLLPMDGIRSPASVVFMG
jgi:hypothetical protein